MRGKLFLVVSLLGATAGAASAQNANDLMRLFGGVIQNSVSQATRQQWEQLPPSQISCADQYLLQRGQSVQALVAQGISPSDPRIAPALSACRPQPSLANATNNSLFVVANTRPPDGWLALRSDPNTKSGERLAKLPNGTKVQVLERQPNDWWLIKVVETGRTGWALSGNGSLRWIVSASAATEENKLQAPDHTRWTVNGSVAYLKSNGDQREFFFSELTPELRNAGATAEAALFSGKAIGGKSYEGILYVYDKNCGKTSYKVSGPILDEYSRVRLEGERPTLAPNCKQNGAAHEVTELVLIRTSASGVAVNVGNPAPATAVANQPQKSDVALRALEGLINVPTTCLDARSSGRNGLSVRDPFSGRSAPGPTCTAVQQCLVSFTAQSASIVSYLRERPLVLTELRKRGPRQGAIENALQRISQNAAQRYDLSNPSCSYLFMAVSNNLFPLESSSYGRADAFEQFSKAAQELLSSVRSDYGRDQKSYEETQAFLTRYDRSSEYRSAKQKYDDAYARELEEVVRVRPEFYEQQRLAYSYRVTLSRQSESLLKMDAQLQDLSLRIAKQPLARLVKANASGDIESLRAEAKALYDIDPAQRGDVSSHLQKLSERHQEIVTRVEADQLRLDALQAMDVRRIELTRKSIASIARLDSDDLKARLSSAALAIKRQLEDVSSKLEELKSVDIVEREDYSQSLSALQSFVGQVLGIEDELRTTQRFAQSVSKVESAIRVRGERFLDPSSSSALRGLSADAKTLATAAFPLNDVQKRKLNEGEEAVADLDRRLPRMMDAKERSYLIDQFPFRQGAWSFSSKTDKLTDETSASAVTSVKGAEANYQIEFTCGQQKRSLAVRTFDLDKEAGKRIDWSVLGTVPAKQVRLRIDSAPAVNTVMFQDGYSNAGLVVMSDALENGRALAESERLVIGDVFPADQIEIRTNLPLAFRRTCELLAVARDTGMKPQ